MIDTTFENMVFFTYLLCIRIYQRVFLGNEHIWNYSFNGKIYFGIACLVNLVNSRWNVDTNWMYIDRLLSTIEPIWLTFKKGTNVPRCFCTKYLKNEWDTCACASVYVDVSKCIAFFALEPTMELFLCKMTKSYYHIKSD